MPTYIIRGQPAFLPRSRWLHLRNEFLKTKNVAMPNTYLIETMIADTEANKETEKFIGSFLLEQHDKNAERFHSEWVHFDISGALACETVYTLLESYCTYYGYAHLTDLRDFQQQLIDDYAGTNIKYPMGQVFALDHFVKPRNWRWKYTTKMTGRIIRVTIIPATVYRLVGDLTDFAVYSKVFRLECGRNFAILPPVEESRSQTGN